jgi:hypothetical protein
VRQNIEASGQSEITTETREKNQNVLPDIVKSIPLSDFRRGYKSTFRELWKASHTALLNLLDFLSELSLADKIGKYPNNCFASGLLRHQFLMLPIVTYIGCS